MGRGLRGRLWRAPKAATNKPSHPSHPTALISIFLLRSHYWPQDVSRVDERKRLPRNACGNSPADLGIPEYPWQPSHCLIDTKKISKTTNRDHQKTIPKMIGPPKCLSLPTSPAFFTSSSNTQKKTEQLEKTACCRVTGTQVAGRSPGPSDSALRCGPSPEELSSAASDVGWSGSSLPVLLWPFFSNNMQGALAFWAGLGWFGFVLVVFDGIWVMWNVLVWVLVARLSTIRFASEMVGLQSSLEEFFDVH